MRICNLLLRAVFLCSLVRGLRNGEHQRQKHGKRWQIGLTSDLILFARRAILQVS